MKILFKIVMGILPSEMGQPFRTNMLMNINIEA